MNKYELTTEKKKREIIHAAMELFKGEGYTGVSIKEIAALARVSQVSIYNYFGSKEALIAECANIIMDDTLKKVKEILEKDSISFAEKIRSALMICTDNINLSISKYFSRKAVDDPALVDLLTKSINEKKQKIYREYIELGKREKVIDEKIPTEIILDFFDAINIVGNKAEYYDNYSAMLNHIHALLLYGLIGKA